MKQYEEVFFALVRTALWKAPLEVPEGFRDWGSVMKLAKSQAMTGLVADVLLRSPQILSTLPERFVARLQEIPLENMGVHTVLNNTLIMVVTRLREHGIEPVLLKGQGLASYYPVPQLRQCGDIDLYVGVENYEKAYEVLEPLVTEIDDKAALKVGKHFHAKVGSVLLEIHRYADVNSSAKLNKVYQEYASKGLTSDLAQVKFSGVTISTPSDDFNAYYVFNHLWHHFMGSGIGVRQFCDLACFLNTHTLDHAYLESLLKDMKQMDAWLAVGGFMVEMLGLDSSKVPCHTPLNKFTLDVILDRVLQEGNFGQSSLLGRKRTRNYFVEKAISLSWHLKRHIMIFRAFPSHVIRQFTYTLTSGFSQVFDDFTRKR